MKAASKEEAQRGLAGSLKKAFPLPLLIDDAADADFATMIERLRGEPGTNRGKQ